LTLHLIVKLAYNERIHIICLPLYLEQACLAYGPRAKCGPRKLFTWPTNPKLLHYHIDCLIETQLEQGKNMVVLLALGDSKKLFLAHHKI